MTESFIRAESHEKNDVLCERLELFKLTIAWN